MDKIVLLAVAAAWAAALIPPLLRSRGDNRPNSSVTDFSRQLSLLGRAVPTRSMAPMRTMGSMGSMGRPLIAASSMRSVAAGRSILPDRGFAVGVSGGARSRGHLHVAAPERFEPARRDLTASRIGPREALRRRRMNVLSVLFVATVLTLFLFATTRSAAMMYAFAGASVALVGYVYKLAQLRQMELNRLHGEAHWYTAA